MSVAGEPPLALRLAKLRATYLGQLPAQVGAVRQAFEALAEADPEPDQVALLHRLVHTLRGGSASFGLTGLAAAAAEAETILKAMLKGAAAPPAAWHRPLAHCLRGLDQALARVDTRPPEAAPAALPVTPDAPAPAPETRSIFLHEEDPALCRALAAQLGCFGFTVTTFESAQAFLAAALREGPEAIVMGMAHRGQPLGGAALAAEILARRPVPLVFLTAQGDLPSRLAAVRAGASACFVKPVSVSDLSGTLNRLTHPEEKEACRVLIVDDDVALAELNAVILQEAGMATCIVNDPMAALPHLFEFRPDLILMDMHMPGCNGMELARAIRQIDSYLSIPIVFLSSETDLDLQFEARRMGGDEFLIKPIKPGHLVSAVSLRAERMKLVRSQMVRDGMTGLYNHTAAKSFLDETVARTRRAGGDFCFAMLDLDQFKTVNDTYGHPMGDQVLMALASLLKQCLRKADIIGRYGGEEFAVILPECPLPKAVACLELIRERFSLIRFAGPDGGFSASFSCGVASFKAFPGATGIGKAADEALYAAKRGGRNRVVAAGGG